MTNNINPITPPPELVDQWVEQVPNEIQGASCKYWLFTQAARWGADQELEACCSLMDDWGLDETDLLDFRLARRPKSPGLKEQALQELDLLTADATTHGLGFDASAIRRALESLPS